MAILRIDRLSFCYPDADVPTLSELSLTVEAGEFVLLSGASGSGKTTLLSLLKPALSPHGTQTGDIWFEEAPLSALSPEAAATDIGFVMQQPEEQTVCDTVLRELCFGAENVGMTADVMRRRVAETADVFGMTRWLHSLTAELSGGQLQQVALASVTVLSPKLLLLDEPTAMLDPIAAARFVEQLRMLNRDYGVTVIMATHRLDETAATADRLIVLERGRVCFDGGLPAAADALWGHPCFALLPQPLRVCRQLGLSARPLTVRDGRHALGDVTVPAPTPPAPTSGDTVLEAKELWFRYSKHGDDVLRGVSLAVRRGECVCLFGGNGSGKSTLLTCLASLKKPYRGRVSGQYAVRLPQDVRAMFTADTVREELERFAARRGCAPARVWVCCETLGIMPWLDRHPMDLSGGERQLAALALVMLADAEILLLDEPTRALDVHAKARLKRALQSLRDSGTAVVIVTHDTVFAAEVATRCALLFYGQVVCDEPPHAFFTGNRFYAPPVTRMTGALTTDALGEGASP